MNNEVEFSTLAHNLLMKTEAENSARQENKNRSTSIQASPQAIKKKRFTKLDITTLIPPRIDSAALTRADRGTNDDDQELPTRDTNSTSGSIGLPVAQNRFTYD
jgi:hypothetical protein